MLSRPLVIFATTAILLLQVLSVSSSTLLPRALANGDKCSTSAQCQSGNCNRAHCADKAPNGHSCYKDVGCISGSCFSGSVCYTPGEGTLANGASCKTSNLCASAYCKHSSCDDKKPNGHVCYKDVGCISGSCVNKKCTPSSTPSSKCSSSSTHKPSSTSTRKSSSSSSKPLSSSSSKPTSSSSKPHTSSSAKSSSSSSASTPKPTVKCTKGDYTGKGLINTEPYSFQEGGTKAFPNARLSFTNVKDSATGNNVLTTISSTGKFIEVDFYDCKSTYMGYKDDDTLEEGQQSAEYGQLRIPSLNNDCLTAETPTGATTLITHKPCSTADDASQIAQFFGILTADLGPFVYYLGGTRSQTGSIQGNDYGGHDFTPGQAYELIRKDSSQNDAQASFFLTEG